MKHALALVATLLAALAGSHLLFGYDVTYRIAYGLIAVLAVLIAATFLWLYRARATPLALGMVFSWCGGAGVMSWWWAYQIFDRPIWMQGNPILFAALAFYITGAILHFIVIQGSLRLRREAFLIPIAAVVGLAGLALIAG